MDRHQTTGTENDVVLRTTGLTKRFGDITAVDSLDIAVRAGEVHGFLGPNGSGKSMTIGMVLGLIKPTEGRVEFRGNVGQDIGAIVETPAFYPYLSGRDNLEALALYLGEVPRQRIDELLHLVGLSDRAASPYKTYSLGMKQRLGIASTLLSDASLVILDEPTNGLDPAGQQEIRALIPRLAGEGRAVLVASHLLYEVQQVCDWVTILRRGKLVHSGSVKDLIDQHEFLLVEVEHAVRAAEILRALPGVERVEPTGDHLKVFVSSATAPSVTRALACEDLYLSALVPQRASLEDVFLELTSDATAISGEGAQE